MPRQLQPEPWQIGGVKDPRTQEASHMARITKEIEQIAGEVPVLKLLENVAGAPKDVKDFYTSIVGGPP